MLLEEFVKPLAVSYPRLNGIVKGRRAVTIEQADRDSPAEPTLRMVHNGAMPQL